MSTRLTIVVLLASLLGASQSCALLRPPPQELVAKGDHAGLANYYKEQAHELREKAKAWDAVAESYEHHVEPHGKVEPEQHAAHCRAAASAFRKAADEADALAAEHRKQLQ